MQHKSSVIIAAPGRATAGSASVQDVRERQVIKVRAERIEAGLQKLDVFAAQFGGIAR